jgi:hypothetical protein
MLLNVGTEMFIVISIKVPYIAASPSGNLDSSPSQLK